MRTASSIRYSACVQFVGYSSGVVRACVRACVYGYGRGRGRGRGGVAALGSNLMQGTHTKPRGCATLKWNSSFETLSFLLILTAF